MQKRVLYFVGTILLLSGFVFYKKFHTSTIAPHEFEQHFNHALQTLLQGKNDQACDLFEQLVAYAPNHPVVLFNYGRALANKHEYAKAIAAYTKALRANSEFKHLLHMHLGINYYALGDADRAEQHFKATLSLQPHFADALYYCGRIASDKKMFDEAAYYFLQAAGIDKQFITCALSIATQWRNAKEFEKAKNMCAKVLELNPEHYYALLMLGDISVMQASPEHAIGYYEKACAANAHCHEAFNNLGTLYAGHYGDYADGYKYLQKALKIDPENPASHAGLSAWYLVHEKYEQGWQEYEWRLHEFFGKREMPYIKPRLNGTQDLHGKTIVVHAEQGLGDTLQFVRYVRLLEKHGAHVILCVQKPLKKLLSLGFDAVYGYGELIPAYDYHVELMSLPYFLKTDKHSIPASIPYVRPDPVLVDYWHKRIEPYKGIKVGICWHVEPCHDADVFRGYEAKISIDACKRSIPLELFKSLASLPNVQLFSLQKGVGMEQVTTVPFTVHAFDELDTAHGSFMDTAALMKSLDLVISADTAIAHVAGSLGVPVWVMLPFPCDWRWLLNRTDSPWYPSMRLFRKKKGDKDWRRVMEEIRADLKRSGRKSGF